MPDLLYMGSAVKALGGGKVAGYLIQYSDAAHPDLSREKDFFTADCDYDLDTGNRKSVFYAHGLDTKMGVKRIGIGEVKQDEVGVWIEAQLSLADEYGKAVYALAEQGKLGWSSGAPSHLVTRKAIETDTGTVHEIKSWPLAEASLTPCPADHRNQAVALKSLPSLLGFAPPAEDHTTKALPAGMSYDDLRALLQDELNEDIGDGDDGPWGGGLWIVDVYDDALVYRDDADLVRIPYTVTATNDVTWGTPETVIRTTVYQPASDGDDAAESDATPTVPMSGKQADVTALKEMLRDSMTFGDHSDVATSAMEGFVARAEGLAETSIKSGRVISAANRARLAKVHGDMRDAHAAMGGHMARLATLLTETDPDAKKESEDFAALRTRFVRLQSDLLHLTG
jgi:hypothetical protein